MHIQVFYLSFVRSLARSFYEDKSATLCSHYEQEKYLDRDLFSSINCP